MLEYYENSITVSEKFMFTSWYGNSSIDNIIVDDLVPEPNGPGISDSNIPQNNDERALILNEKLLLIGLFGLISIAGVGFFITKLNIKPAIDIGIHLTDNTSKIIKNIFGRNTVSYFVIGQNFIGKENIDPDLAKEFPPEMLKYKFLMHPVKLAICRVLIENTLISSAEVRKKLGVSWSDYSNQIKALNENGFIDVEDKIVDGSVKQVVSISPSGVEEYNKLISILIAFIDNSPLYYKLMKESKDNDHLNSN